MKPFFIFLIFIGLSIVVVCETTPLEKELKEDGVTIIELDFKRAELKLKSGVDSELIDGTYHYNVYVPAGYNANKDKKYFCLFIASPGGNAGLGNVQTWAKEKEWIVVMLVESKNGPLMPSLSNFVAAHDDAIIRLRIQDGFKFATGFSGGARVSSHFPYLRSGFGGIILQGAGFGYGGKGSGYESVRNNKSVTVFGIIGKTDSNLVEIERMKKDLPRHTISKFVTPDTGHRWASDDVMREALEWSSNIALTSAKMTEDNKSFILEFRTRQWTENKDAKNSLNRFSQLEGLDRFLKLNKIDALGSEENVQPLVVAQLAEMKKDPQMAKENSALRAYKSVENAENILRDRVKDKKQLAPKMKSIFAQYKAVSSKFEGTEYGVKAKEIAESLENEFFGKEEVKK